MPSAHVSKMRFDHLLRLSLSPRSEKRRHLFPKIAGRCHGFGTSSFQQLETVPAHRSQSTSLLGRQALQCSLIHFALHLSLQSFSLAL
eukprot:Skav205876  [mRNA]  locus=scaffold766:244531:246382:- [translate_table: standard]